LQLKIDSVFDVLFVFYDSGRSNKNAIYGTQVIWLSGLIGNIPKLKVPAARLRQARKIHGGIVMHSPQLGVVVTE
jgi:hypothetical protein